MRFSGPLMGSMRKEIEYQRTNLALGRPVDVEMLFRLLDEEVAAQKADLEEKIADLEEDRDEMIEAIDKAIEEMNDVRTVFAQEILGRLNLIDRKVVAWLVKDQLKALDLIQTNLKKSKP